MNTKHSFSNVTDSRLPMDEGLVVRSRQFLKAAARSTGFTIGIMQLEKRHIEVTVFAAGTRTFENLKTGTSITGR